MDKAKKNDLTINKYVDDKDQTLESVVEGEICIELLENLSLWRCSIFVTVRKNMLVLSLYVCGSLIFQGFT